MQLTPLRFISESITVEFDEMPTLVKKQGCPNRFVWREQTYEITEVISAWHDYARKGRMEHNMRASHLKAARRRGSWGVGRDYYQVLTASSRIFELYYDRAPKHQADRKGTWVLYRELTEDPVPQNFTNIA